MCVVFLRVGWIVRRGIDAEACYYFGCGFRGEVVFVFRVFVRVRVAGLLVECRGGR